MDGERTAGMAAGVVAASNRALQADDRLPRFARPSEIPDRTEELANTKTLARQGTL